MITEELREKQIKEFQKDLHEVEQKLQQLRAKWRTASPGMKKMIEVTAKIHTDKKERLTAKLERYTQTPTTTGSFSFD